MLQLKHPKDGHLFCSVTVLRELLCPNEDGEEVGDETPIEVLMNNAKNWIHDSAFTTMSKVYFPAYVSCNRGHYFLVVVDNDKCTITIYETMKGCQAENNLVAKCLERVYHEELGGHYNVVIGKCVKETNENNCGFHVMLMMDFLSEDLPLTYKFDKKIMDTYREVLGCSVNLRYLPY
jgi:Ulp1 family protease